MSYGLINPTGSSREDIGATFVLAICLSMRIYAVPEGGSLVSILFAASAISLFLTIIWKSFSVILWRMDSANSRSMNTIGSYHYAWNHPNYLKYRIKLLLYLRLSLSSLIIISGEWWENPFIFVWFERHLTEIKIILWLLFLITTLLFLNELNSWKIKLEMVRVTNAIRVKGNTISEFMRENLWLDARLELISLVEFTKELYIKYDQELQRVSVNIERLPRYFLSTQPETLFHRIKYTSQNETYIEIRN